MAKATSASMANYTIRCAHGKISTKTQLLYCYARTIRAMGALAGMHNHSVCCVHGKTEADAAAGLSGSKRTFPLKSEVNYN